MVLSLHEGKDLEQALSHGNSPVFKERKRMRIMHIHPTRKNYHFSRLLSMRMWGIKGS